MTPEEDASPDIFATYGTHVVGVIEPGQRERFVAPHVVATTGAFHATFLPESHSKKRCLHNELSVGPQK